MKRSSSPLLLVLALSACGFGIDPGQNDGGPARCADLASAVSGGPDGGVSYVGYEGLDFPKSGTICLEPGQRYTIQVEPHALASFDLVASAGSFDVEVQRGGALLSATRGTGAMHGWAVAGKNPVSLVVSAVRGDRAVFDYGLTLAGLGPSRYGPVTSSDGGTGSLELEPSVTPALAPLISPSTASSFLAISINLDRAIEAVLDETSCEPTPLFPERFFAVELDAGSYRISDLGLSAPDYHLRALRSDGGVAVAGTLTSLASVNFTLPVADRIALGANIPVSRRTCGFDGGLPPDLSGSARFDLR